MSSTPPEASYPGPWSFGHLMDQAFGADKSRQAVAAWLDSWSRGTRATAAGGTDLPHREIQRIRGSRQGRVH